MEIFDGNESQVIDIKKDNKEKMKKIYMFLLWIHIPMRLP